MRSTVYPEGAVAQDKHAMMVSAARAHVAFDDLVFTVCGNGVHVGPDHVVNLVQESARELLAVPLEQLLKRQAMRRPGKAKVIDQRMEKNGNINMQTSLDVFSCASSEKDLATLHLAL